MTNVKNGAGLKVSAKTNVVATDVVQHDTATAANVVAGDKLVTQLQAMEASRISWENNELVASNKRLYSILKEAYAFYWEMKKNGDKAVREQYKQALEQFIKQRGYTFTATSHDMTRVVKCVFGVDRRRVSAYSIALRAALEEEISVDELVAFIEDAGGVEEIRTKGGKALSASQKAEDVKQEVLCSDLGVLKFDAEQVRANADWVDKQVVIVATYLPTGEFQANAVVQHDTAVNAALAAYRSVQQAKQRADEKAQRDADKAELDAAKKELAEEKERVKAAEKAQRQARLELKKAKQAAADAVRAATAKTFDDLYEVAV